MTQEDSEKRQGKQEKGEIKSSRPSRRPPSMIEPFERSEFMRDVDRVFEDFRRNFEDLIWPIGSLESRMNQMLPRFAAEFPRVDIEDRGKDFCMTVEVPGYKKEDIDIEIEDQAVEIRGIKSMRTSEKNERYVRQERALESFHRRVDMPEEIDTNAVEASMNDGVLELVLPKKNPKPRTKVNIK